MELNPGRQEGNPVTSGEEKEKIELNREKENLVVPVEGKLTLGKEKGNLVTSGGGKGI